MHFKIYLNPIILHLSQLYKLKNKILEEISTLYKSGIYKLNLKYNVSYIGEMGHKKVKEHMQEAKGIKQQILYMETH